MYGEQKDKAFVSSETYKRIVEKAYEINWDDFVSQFDEENIFGMQAIHKLYIYVNSLSQVENVARMIESMGYSTNYTFKSFSNFSASIGWAFLDIGQYKYILMILCLSIVLQLFTNRIIVRMVLKSYTRKNIIDLLKKSKEFE